MGLYGSPDTGNLYTKRENPFKKKKPFKPDKLIWIILIVDTIILWLVGVSESNLLTVLSLDSIILFIYGLIMLIYNAYKRENVGVYVVVIGVAIILFFVSVLQLGSGSNLSKNNNINANKNYSANYSAIDATDSVGSRKKPAKMGDIVQTKAVNSNGLSCEVEIELTGFKRGEEAVKIMREGHSTADNPGEGKEFALVKFRVKNIKDNSGKDIPFNLASTEFSYATGDYAVIDTRWSVPGLNPDIKADLYEGAEHEGWVCFSIEKDDTAPKVVFLNEIWFDL